jgi:Zn-dependent protease/predicted transcriptional regulator
MFKSYEIGDVSGIPIRLDVTFLLILPVFAGMLGAQIESIIPLLNDTFGTTIDAAALTTGLRPWLIGFVAAVVLFTCVTLHELGHSAMAMHFGYEVESITLWLLGGIAKPAEIPRNWRQEFWIAVAGPLVNIVIVAGCAVGLVALPRADIAVFLLLYLAMLNLGLATFNMLPAFPLDGGRVLRALLARNRSYLDATRLAATVGKGFAVLLGILGLISFDIIMMGVAVFVYIAATSEARQMMFDAAFEGLTIADVMTPVEDIVTVDASRTARDFLNMMLAERHIAYPVFDGRQFVGIVTFEDVQSVQHETATVADVMTPIDDIETVTPSTTVTSVLRKLGDSESGRLPVVDKRGSLRGIVTRTDLIRAFRAVSAKRRDPDTIRVEATSDSGDSRTHNRSVSPSDVDAVSRDNRDSRESDGRWRPDDQS